MSLDPTLLFLSLISGGIGLVLFIYGKKQQRPPHLVAGLVLMAYPYVVSSVVLTILIGILILIGLWLAVRQGW